MVEKWEKIKDQLYTHLQYRKVAKQTYRLPDGSFHDFDIVLNREVSIVVALTPEDRIVIAKQYRPGPDKVLLELPAGVVDPGETPDEAAKRELLEETGYTGDFEYVGSSYRDAYSTIVLHSFVAKNVHLLQNQALEPDEFIEVEQMSLSEFRSHLKSGQLTDVGPAYQALDYLGLL